MKQSEGYFAKCGLIVPADCGGFVRNAFSPGFDYERLAPRVYGANSDMPPELVEGLHLVHEIVGV